MYSGFPRWDVMEQKNSHTLSPQVGLRQVNHHREKNRWLGFVDELKPAGVPLRLWTKM